MIATIWWLIALITATITESTTLTIPPPSEPGCSANYAFIYVESSSGSITGKTITSDRVNYAPYTYTQTVPRRKLVSFAADEIVNDTTNNPCDITTWTLPPSHYSDAIVMMQYNLHFSTLCTPQEWTLNIQNYTNVQALLIANTVDLTNVYPLHGDSSLPQPHIPTRMISQSSSINLLKVLNTTEEVYISIGCFDISSPPIICIVDDSNIGSNVELDGDFQQQGRILVNDHPVWMKEGMTRVWNDYYMWLSVDTSLLINAWKWVIGTNFNDESSIIAECILNTVEYIDDPTLCGHNWYRNGVKISNLTSSDGVCDLGDSYVCANSGSQFFDYYFGGRYRQVHDGTAVWLSDNTAFDAYISVEYVNRSFAHGWSFVFSYAANGGTYAFCPISDTQPTAEMTLNPWDCNKNWYVVAEDEYGGWLWFNDPLMDVDECSHPDAPTQEVPTTINYPKTLCFMDPTYKYSQYQSYYGLYTLNESLHYGGRHVYRNERLKSKDDDWYMIWYEEKDAWIINEYKVSLPTDLYASAFGGICRDNVDTPDQCTSCWEFFEGVSDEINCDAKVITMITDVESDCMTLPMNNIAQYADDVMLCFNDGSSDVLQSPYTGKWKLETRATYNGRSYWYKATSVIDPVQYYMYYDEVWRYWVINPTITADESNFELFCLHWDEFEPFNCDTWYTSSGLSVSMGSDCSVQPTASPTPHPTTECIEYNKYIYAASPAFTHQILQSAEVNFPPYSSSTFYHIKLVPFEALTMDTGNPCDSSTWAQSASYYDESVVLIEHSTFYESLCSPQQWTLQLENYANVVGVIVSNNADLTHVYSLSGDEGLIAPTIPTRMVSQMAGHLLDYALERDDPVYISLGCFDDTVTVPSTICLVDTTIVGEHVYLDGEYQRQAIEVNNHPVWLKQGHIGLWGNIYMFLDVDRSQKGTPSWRWVIGTDYNDRSSIIAECNLNGRHIAHPALCDHDWSINDTLASNITTKGTQCSLGDKYVCVESANGGFFESYFEGRYRQVHEGVPLWLLENEYLDAHVRIARLSWPAIFGANSKYVFAFMVNQSSIYAFCVIGEDYPTPKEALSPWECNDDWYVVSWSDTGYQWVIDLAFDIDECTHPNISTTQQPINYPEILCLSDPSNAHSHYQSRYGVYILDTNTTFDGRYVYRNQRLDGTHNEWYMLWYEEKDAWVINEMIPGVTVVRDTDGICREDVATPDLCNECWEFSNVHGVFGENCFVTASIASNNMESHCMSLPSNNVIHYNNEVSLCFDDGTTTDWDNVYTGDWILETTDTYNDRAYWYKLDSNGFEEYYMFYDSVWRYWVIDRVLGRPEDTRWFYLHWYCLNWDDFEPFNCDIWYPAASNVEDTMSMTRDCVSSAPTPKPTLRPTISCDARETWIYAESENYILIEETLISQYANFAPYVYDTFDERSLVLFEGGRNMSKHSSNPCDYYTWVEYPIYYEEKVVMVYLNKYIATLCSVEQWTWNLETYAHAKAVIVVNDADLYHVYALSGDDGVSNPSIPTRMISQFAGHSIRNLVDQNENVLITFGCFDDELSYPPIICLIDTSIMGTHVYLDGEYQRQNIDINEHPVWLKTGFEGLWKSVYMFLDIDPSINGESSWRWVIGTNYNDRESIIAECRLHDKDLDHPALCDGHWYIDNELASNVITSDTTCALGDNYICVESASGRLFDYYFDGQYRQIHEGVPLWLLEDSSLDAYITVGQITLPPLFDNEYIFAFVVNQSDIYAFCPIGSDVPTLDESLSPWKCNEDWYKIDLDANNAYQWVLDYEFDIDECLHHELTTEPPQYVSYPEVLCLSDPTHAYSRYQSHYGVYVLDTSRTYDNKYVYYNQRLAGNHDEWFMIWYEEKDAWVINEMIPEVTVVHNNDGICRDEVFTPDLCHECWEFADIHGVFESNCNVKVHKMVGTKENDCMRLPVNDMVFPEDYTPQITLGFGDDKTSMHKNGFSGIWRLETNHQYLDRSYWYKAATNTASSGIDYYMFYDPTWRYWVIDHVLGNTINNEWHLYCIQWDEFEPFKCDTWYSSIGLEVRMDTNYTMPTTTATPIHPTGITESNLHLIPYIGWSFGFVAIAASLICLACYYRKKKEKHYMFEDVSKDGGFKTIYGVTRDDDDDMIQMENVAYVGGTLGSATGKGTKGKGEIVAVDDSDSDDCVISPIIDDGEGLVTRDDEMPLNNKPQNWVKFEE